MADLQAEKRFQQLKRKLEALRYNQPLCKYDKYFFNKFIAFESAALAEKLLNDYLKATEAFNKVKSMNDQLKVQAGSN